ncbi:serine protease [Methylobacterium sp. WL19]|uniref:S1 family peptidase n=1 Tax=Methylobacterium sp. WL19 TaxID=2603896 RepID=UPI0011CC74E2|nr:serine protease [Methylobacterium sp. WL19]TXN33062.1 trypsin-like peptidase domain-containing protein [Methylobacterium sp. WL19]
MNLNRQSWHNRGDLGTLNDRKNCILKKKETLAMKLRMLSVAAQIMIILSLCHVAAVAQNGPSIYAQYASGVLLIKVYGIKYDGSIEGSTGTGFFIGTEGDILTAGHVILDRSKYKDLIITAQAGPSTAESKIISLLLIKKHPIHDVALLRPSNVISGATSLPLRNAKPNVGEDLYVLGYPLGLPNTHLIDGIIGSVVGENITTNALVEKGNSGGPVVDANGCVMGIVYGGITATEEGPVNGIKFAIAASELKDFLPNNISTGKREDKSENDGLKIHVTDVLSRVQNTHDISYTTNSYSDTIPARAGYKFDSVDSVGHVSLNPPELTYPKPIINPDGKALSLNYSLVSGPFYDRKRGWIEMTINSTQIRIGKNDEKAFAGNCE